MACSSLFSLGFPSYGYKDQRISISASGQSYKCRMSGQLQLSKSYVKPLVIMAVNGRPGRNLPSPSGSEWHFSEQTESENVPEQYGDNSTMSLFPSSLAQNSSLEDLLQRSRSLKERGTQLKKPEADSFSKSKIEGLNGKPYKNTVGNEGEEPYRILDTGEKVYLDELDVLTLLDPPEFLQAFDYQSYNHAFFIWKKIGNIPEERRNRLLDLLTPRHISKMWEFAGLQYGTLIPFEIDTKDFLLGSEHQKPLKPVIWIGQTTGEWKGISRLGSNFKKVFFLGTNGTVYGRAVAGGWLVEKVTRWLVPSYFQVRNAKNVLATNEDCSMAFEYGNGYIGLKDIPTKFPRPVKHPWPFNYRVVEYIRPVGPGVFVGQLWHEGKSLEQTSRKLAGQFVMIKDFKNVSSNQL